MTLVGVAAEGFFGETLGPELVAQRPSIPLVR